MRNRWLLVACTVAGIVGCVVLGDAIIECPPILRAACIVVGALAGFGLYELVIFLAKKKSL